MGYAAGLGFPDAAAVYGELRGITRGVGALDLRGISHARLAAGPLQWPCPDAEHSGTARLYADRRFATPSGKARFGPASFVPPAEQPDDEHPFWLTTGRVLEQWHTRTRTGEVPRLNSKASGSWVEIHPDDALALGVGEGDRVLLTSRRGACATVARLVENIVPGTLFMPFHWAESNPNQLTNPAVDPRSKQPELKACAAQLTPLERPMTLTLPQRERQPVTRHYLTTRYLEER
jgi:predicted molibdopterin-dependent oxidoreductase YjgC